MDRISSKQLMEKDIEVEKEVVMELCKLVKEHFGKQPNVLMIDEIPEKGICCVGDIHGNGEDLVSIFNTFGMEEGNTFLFLGDFIDRGEQSLRVLFLIFCLILENKQRIYCLRGNHETLKIARAYGLLNECRYTYSSDDYELVFAEIMDVLKNLPLAAVVKGKYFCVHGGLGPGFEKIEDLKAVDRKKVELCERNLGRGGYYELDPMPLMDLLWSDPVEDKDGFNRSERGCGYLWGKDVSEKFLKDNGLEMIIRSHEFCQFGLKYSHDKKVMTIFSSSNYCYSSNCAVFAVIHSDLKVETVMFSESNDD